MLELKDNESSCKYWNRSMYNDLYFDGFSEGFRKTEISMAISYYREYKKGNKNLKPLQPDMMEEIRVFDEKYRGLSSEKLCEIISLESEHLVRLKIKK